MNTQGVKPAAPINRPSPAPNVTSNVNRPSVNNRPNVHNNNNTVNRPNVNNNNNSTVNRPVANNSTVNRPLRPATINSQTNNNNNNGRPTTNNVRSSETIRPSQDQQQQQSYQNRNTSTVGRPPIVPRQRPISQPNQSTYQQQQQSNRPDGSINRSNPQLTAPVLSSKYTFHDISKHVTDRTFDNLMGKSEQRRLAGGSAASGASHPPLYGCFVDVVDEKLVEMITSIAVTGVVGFLHSRAREACEMLHGTWGSALQEKINQMLNNGHQANGPNRPNAQQYTGPRQSSNHNNHSNQFIQQDYDQDELYDDRANEGSDREYYSSNHYHHSSDR